MFIQVQGCNDGFEGRLRARRFWPNGAPVRVEIVESDDGSDPPDLDRRDDQGKVIGTRPDPIRIGRKSLAELKADTCIRVMSDDDTQGEQAGLALAEVKKLAAQHAANVADLTAELAMVSEENAKLVANVADLTAQLAEATSKTAALEAQLADAPKTSADPEPEVDQKTAVDAKTASKSAKK